MGPSKTVSIQRNTIVSVFLLLLCAEVLLFGLIGNASFFDGFRNMQTVENFLNTPGPLRKQPWRGFEEVPVAKSEIDADAVLVRNTKEVSLQTTTTSKNNKLPPDYFFDKPFYVYDDLVWLNATFNGETVEEMIQRTYLWKHNDDLWFLNAALTHPMRTHDPKEAVLFVVPSLFNMILSPNVHANGCYGDLCGIDMAIAVDKYLGESPWFQRSGGKDHVVVASLYSASMRLAWFPNIVQCNMISHENRKWNQDDRYTASSYYVGSPCLPQRKEHDFAMIATLKNRPTFESRWNICKWLSEERPDYSVALCGQGEQCPALAQARLGFHVRGDTYGANRLIDTILTGTVPIFTMKEQYEILPDWIRWDDISYFADVNDKDSFLRSIDQIMNDEELYQQKLTNLMANRAVFDWRTHVPFDTYMYMFLAQNYPHYRKQNAESPFSVLQLSKPGGFDVFDSTKKQVWCGDSGPANTCGECGTLLGSHRRGCDKMCHWCDFGFKSPQDIDFLDIQDTCVPSYYQCKEAPDVESLIDKTAQPYKPLHQDVDWCINIDEKDRQIQGLLLAKTYKTGSSTAAAVSLQIADRVGKRKGFSSCIVHERHELSTTNMITARELYSSVVWTTVRDPAARAISAFAFYKAGKAGQEPADERLMKFMYSNRNNQIAQLKTKRGESAKGGQPSIMFTPIPPDRRALQKILGDEIVNFYNFIAVAERMDESLVVMKMLWGLEDGDIIVASAKQSGGWTYDWEHPESCFHIPKLNVSKAVQDFIDTDFAENNFDYDLYAHANLALDRTIESLGKKRVQKELEKHQRLKKSIMDLCRKEIVFPCSDEGTWQPEHEESCFKDDLGCGYPCINSYLDLYEAGKFEPISQLTATGR